MTWIIERHSCLWTYASFPSVSLQVMYFRDDKSPLYLSWARHHCETHCNGTEVYSKVRSGLHPSQGAQEAVPTFLWANDVTSTPRASASSSVFEKLLWSRVPTSQECGIKTEYTVVKAGLHDSGWEYKLPLLTCLEKRGER